MTAILITQISLLQWISVPFALVNPAVSDITVSAKEAIYQSPWLGKIDSDDKWFWIDNFCLLVRHFSLKIPPTLTPPPPPQR